MAETDTRLVPGAIGRPLTRIEGPGKVTGATRYPSDEPVTNLAYAYLMLGNGAKANEFAGRALKAAPNHPSVLDTVGWVRFKTGQDRTGGLALLRRAATLAPQNTTIRAHLAEAERAR